MRSSPHPDECVRGYMIQFLGFSSLGRWLPRADDARYRLEIIGDLDALPTLEEIPDAVNNRAADFQHNPSSGPQRHLSLRDQVGDHFCSRGPGKYRRSRLKLANLQLNLIFLRFANVGWIGNDQVEGGI